MPIMFNQVLHDAGLPLADVRLIRHIDKRAKRGRRPYELWCDDRPQFELYQSHQALNKRRKTLSAPYWAVFVVNLNNETMFVGLYTAQYRGLLEHDELEPTTGEMLKARSVDVYDLRLQDTLSDLIGILVIDWGPAPITWVQYADRQNKRIIKGLPAGYVPTLVSRTSDRTLAEDEDIRELERNKKIEATTKAALIKARRGQGEFGTQVLGRWENACAVTRSTTLEAIIASHIKPWRKSNNKERLDPANGLPLVASLDALFDAGLVSFDASGRMIVSSTLNDTERQIFALDGSRLKRRPSAKTATYLAYHRKHVYVQ